MTSPSCCVRALTPIGVTLGDGWYRGYLGFGSGNRNTYGDRLALLLQLVITSAVDQEVLGSDAQSERRRPDRSDVRDLPRRDRTTPAWRRRVGRCRDSPSMAGRLCAWRSHRKDNLVAPAGPPVAAIGELKPVKILKTPAGDTVVRHGPEHGRLGAHQGQGPAGTTVTLRHAEVLDKQGNFYASNLRKARHRPSSTR